MKEKCISVDIEEQDTLDLVTYLIDAISKYFHNNLKPIFLTRIVLNMLPYLSMTKDIPRSMVMVVNKLISQGIMGISCSIRHE